MFDKCFQLRFRDGTLCVLDGCTDGAFKCLDFPRARSAALFKVFEDNCIVVDLWRNGSDFGRNNRQRLCLAIAIAIGTNELAILIQYNANFLFKRHAAKERIDCFAAGNAIVIAVASGAGGRNKMLDTSVCFWKGHVAKEANASLGEH